MSPTTDHDMDIIDDGVDTEMEAIIDTDHLWEAFMIARDDEDGLNAGRWDTPEKIAA